METLLFDPARAETRVAFGMAEAEVAQRAQWRSAAEVFRAIEATLREAAAHPEVFIDAPFLRGDVTEFAERAAAADLAVRLSMAEGTVRTYGAVASTLRERLPSVWAFFGEGEISPQNAREASSVVLELPDASWAAFDAGILDAARTLAPARFRAKARALREQLHTRPLEERRKAAESERRVWSEQDRDGMGWLHAYLPVDQLALATTRVDAIAFDLFKDGDEKRTMSQLRADVLADLLTGASTGAKPKVSVALTIPVLSLLGAGSAMPNLEGVGPIDLDTARKLAGDSPSITRLLTDPVTGAVLQMDAKQYRVTAPMKRWFSITHATCDFPGCGRRAVNCDLDHTIAWPEGGTTIGNLAPRCRKHHTMKHQTKWHVEQSPGAPRPVWTSPTGYRRAADPPPF